MKGTKKNRDGKGIGNLCRARAFPGGKQGVGEGGQRPPLRETLIRKHSSFRVRWDNLCLGE